MVRGSWCAFCSSRFMVYGLWFICGSRFMMYSCRFYGLVVYDHCSFFILWCMVITYGSYLVVHALGVWPLICSLRFMVCRWSLACSLWFMTYVSWCMASGLFLLAYGVGLMVYGA
jgi:hypothetical protein